MLASPAYRTLCATGLTFLRCVFWTIAGKKTIKVTFVKPDGEKVTVDAKIGDSMLEVAHANKIDVEGACGGETACSTCHIILKPEVYSKLPPASEAEEDMLDLAAGLTKTSRLGCQVRQRGSMRTSSRSSRLWNLQSLSPACNFLGLTLQVLAAPELDGIEVALPSNVNNMMS